MLDTPKVDVQEIAVVLKDTPTAFCRNTKHDGVKMCFDKNLDVTKWLYEPDIFARVFKADIDKLRSKVSECPVCQRTAKVMELRKKDGEQHKIITDSLATFAYTLLEDLSRQENVPIPEVKIGTCPSPEARTKTCYLVKEDSMSFSDKRDPGTIWIHPEDIGPTSITHEFYHYKEYQKGNEFDAHDEQKANAYARLKVNEMFPEVSEDFNSETTIFKLTGVNEMPDDKHMLSGFWKLLAGKSQGISGADIDNAFTPEIISRSIETVTDIMMPKFGSVVANALLGALFFGGTMLNQVPTRWKKTLLEMSGHHLFKSISLFNPRDFSVITSQAYDFGKSITTFNGSGLAGSFFRGFDILGQDMRIASQTIDNIMKTATPPQAISTQVKQKYSTASPIPGLDLGISQS